MASERPSTPPSVTAISKPGILPRSPLTPEQIKKIVEQTQAFLHPLKPSSNYPYCSGNKPPESQSSEATARSRIPQNQPPTTTHYPLALLQQLGSRRKTHPLIHLYFSYPHNRARRTTEQQCGCLQSHQRWRRKLSSPGRHPPRPQHG